MKTIDFLPDIYRQREALRRARVWWAIVVLVFGLAISASAAAQVWLRRGLNAQLEDLAVPYTSAQTQAQELSVLQAQIARAAQEATLYTYLETPWPRTQILAEIVRPLPDTIRLTQIHIGEEEPARVAAPAGPRHTKSEEEAAQKASPPDKDFANLRDEVDRRQTTVEVDGYTTDVARLHQYVADVSHSTLIFAASIKSLEAAADHPGDMRFTLRLIVRPPYGQNGADPTPVNAPAGGPTPSKSASRDQRDQTTHGGGG